MYKNVGTLLKHIYKKYIVCKYINIKLLCKVNVKNKIEYNIVGST